MVNIHLIKSDKFKTISISALIRVQLERKYVTFNALIPYVLKRGCMKYDTVRKMNDKIDSMYGAVFDANIMKKGEEQIIQFYAEIVQEYGLLDEAAEFLSEIITNPLIENGGFKKEYVEGEKANLKKEIDGRADNKKEYAKLRCIEEMCGNEAFGLYGDGYADDLKNINEKNLYEHYKEIIETSDIELFVVGNTNEERLNELAEKYFKIQSKNIKKLYKADFSFEKKEPEEVNEEDGISQGKLCIGLRTGIDPASDDFYKLMTANEIFGGGANSKLFLKVREEKSLCYYISSFIYRFKSILCIQSGIDKKDYNDAMDIIKKCFEETKNGKFNDEEFTSAVKGLVKKYKGIEDYPAAIMDFYLSQYMLDDKDTIADVTEKLSNINKKDISDVLENAFIDTVYFLY